MSMPSSDEVQIETVVTRLRRHGRRLLLPVIVLLAIAAASGYWMGTLPEPWMNIAALIGAPLLAILLGILPILSWLSTHATITTRRVIIRRGFLVHHRSELPLSRVREVRTRRSVVQRICGSGDIELLVGIETPYVVRDVPQPQLVVDALQELIQRGYGQEQARVQFEAAR